MIQDLIDEFLRDPLATGGLDRSWVSGWCVAHALLLPRGRFDTGDSGEGLKGRTSGRTMTNGYIATGADGEQSEQRCISLVT